MKSKLLNIAFVLISLSFLSTICINIIIAIEYLRVDAKTKALFGIKEMYQFSYQYYVPILGIVAIVLSVFSSGLSKRKSLAILLAVASIAFVFLRAWRVVILFN